MKDLRKMSREDLEKALDRVDAKNSNVVGVKKAGTVSKTETYSVICGDVSAYVYNNISVTFKLYAPYTGREHHVARDIFYIAADCPADSLDDAISTCDDIINAKTFKDKADVLGSNPTALTLFPVDIDIFYLLKKKYLTDLRPELIGRCFDLSDDDWADDDCAD